MSKNAAKLILGDNTIDLPILDGTLGPSTIDVRALKSTGYFTFDAGFYSTAACESKITFIDGMKGILLHRGYPIDQLAEHYEYLDVCYLLMHGELPTPDQQQNFRKKSLTLLSSTNKLLNFSVDSVVMHTPWPSWSVWWAHSPPFITIH